MHKRIGKLNPIYLEEWVIVKSFDEFVKTIQKRGVPSTVSFDHDLCDEHYDPTMSDGDYRYNELYDTFKKKTGYDAAKWLLEYCKESAHPLPTCFVHSMNPVGCQNIQRILK